MGSLSSTCNVRMRCTTLSPRNITLIPHESNPSLIYVGGLVIRPSRAPLQVKYSLTISIPHVKRRRMVGRAVYNAAAGLLKRRQLLQSSEGRKVASEQGITVPHVWRARCGPSDLDVNLHMNNASYLYCAELARWELSVCFY